MAPKVRKAPEPKLSQVTSVLGFAGPDSRAYLEKIHQFFIVNSRDYTWRGLPHGNLKPTNILLAGPEYEARLTLITALMTPAGIAEQILNMGALGYRARNYPQQPNQFPHSRLMFMHLELS
uniref:Protein kinase domain-containing protein n=1 Tax=Cannabis sativa TaxID=3483 RepID=A0A803NT32_CANSA